MSFQLLKVQTVQILPALQSLYTAAKMRMGTYLGTRKQSAPLLVSIRFTTTGLLKRELSIKLPFVTGVTPEVKENCLVVIWSTEAVKSDVQRSKNWQINSMSV